MVKHFIFLRYFDFHHLYLQQIYNFYLQFNFLEISALNRKKLLQKSTQLEIMKK